jgi:predicted CoA-binding protein
MLTLEEAAQDFLAQKRIAVAGVSRQGDTAGNIIYKKLRESGYQAFAVNPNAGEVEGDKCYPNLAAIPDGVDGLVIAAPPQAAVGLVRECAEAGVKRVWMHRSFGQGSVDEEATRLGRELGLTVIPGSCPMMFCEPVDIAHKCMRWFIRVSGRQPQP